MSLRVSMSEALAHEDGSSVLSPTALNEAFNRASVDGVRERRVVLAGHVVSFRFASDELTRLMEAFAHLPSSSSASTPDLTVNVWDGPAPPLPDFDPASSAHGARVILKDAPLRACFQPGQETYSVLDDSTSVSWFWCAHSRTLAYWEYAAPVRLLLSWWLRQRHAALVHGASVGTENGGALIVGRGGSGKSTTALLSLLAGLSYASDDYVAVEGRREGRGPHVHSVYSSGKLDDGQAVRFPELGSSIMNPVRAADEKSVFLVHRFAPDLVTTGFPLRAVLVPRITGRPETVVSPGSRLAALAALAPSTIFQLPGEAGGDLQFMADLVRDVPCFDLELGTDFDQIPARISDLLSELSRGDG